MILDEDRPGNIGFKERFISVRRKDLLVFVTLERMDGSDGEISCKINSKSGSNVGGNKEATEGSDFMKID